MLFYLRLDHEPAKPAASSFALQKEAKSLVIIANEMAHRKTARIYRKKMSTIVR